MPIPALIAAGASLAGGLLSNLAASNAQSRSIAAQRSLQNMLMTGGAQMARNAKQAGLSPAFSLGQSSTPAASSPASNYANYDFSSMQNLLGGINQRKLQKQQEKVAKAEELKLTSDARIADEKAKQEQIITENMRTKQGEFTRQHTKITLPDGSLLYDDAANEYLSNHPDFDPNKVEIVRGLTEGQRQARQTMEENEILSLERGSREREITALDVERAARISNANYNKVLSDMRRNSSSIMRCLAAMPEKEYEMLERKIEGQKLENAYRELYNKQFEESSAGRLIEQLKMDGSFGDKLLSVLVWIANNIKMSASASAIFK